MAPNTYHRFNLQFSIEIFPLVLDRMQEIATT
jgi:hypothetical protein